MPDAVQSAYSSAAPDVQNKLRRLVEVWRQRNVFEAPITEAVEARMDAIDKTKGTGGKKLGGLMGQSLTGSSGGGVPKELEPLAKAQADLDKVQIGVLSAKGKAETEYSKLDSTKDTPDMSLGLHAAKLSGLMSVLAGADKAVTEALQARKKLISELEKLLAEHKRKLAEEEADLEQLKTQYQETEKRKRKVEDDILKGYETTTNGNDDTPSAPANDFARPEFEALTPPHPDMDTQDDGSFIPTIVPATNIPVPKAPEPQPQSKQEPVSTSHPELQDLLAGMRGGAAPQIDLKRDFSGYAYGVNGNVPPKKRKMSHSTEEAAFIAGLGTDDGGMGGLDDEVAELLKQESGGQGPPGLSM